MMCRSSASFVVVATLVAACASPALSQEAAVEDGPKTLLEEIEDALLKGSIHLDIRLRAEIVEQDELDTAQAYTSRLRMGYGTRPFRGLSFYAEFEDIRSADEDLYNAAGLNNEPDKAVVADPEDTELNQFFARYESEYFEAIAGRQRIILDDARFIGNVGWRQNEQTFDAYTILTEWIPDTRVYYSYVDDVNRIFGPDANLDFESDSHLINASFSGFPFDLEVAAFAYIIDLDNSDINSSDTVGTRASGSQELPNEMWVKYAASYAYQVDGGSNQVDYEASYYFIEATLGAQGLGSLGVGYEVLESDDGAFAFQTPLATLHAFNGWADVFTVTPADGLEDLYFTASTRLPYDVDVQAIYHLFFSEDRSRDFGGEFDAMISKAITEHIGVSGYLAVFHGESGFPNVQKYWLVFELKS